ncbi:MAG: tetraacyldisaccharide 4'-kinase [Candidatus Omnitrophica bacterium]|nr:tetraacyldisaccharide 4'-kinase [Candidatus Omnitrophota bacterium]
MGCRCVEPIKTLYQKNIAARQERGFLSYALWPTTVVYGIGSFLHNFKYENIVVPQKVDKPVISVGNITVGGTGKTPFIAYLGHKLRELGKQCAIVTRGYGIDEVRLLDEHVPDASIIVDKDRYNGIRQFLASRGVADVFLMDDGFQHRNVRRDLDIVLINGLNPFGNGFLVPAGTLREPITALTRADLIAITHADQISEQEFIALAQKISAVAVDTPIIGCAHSPLALINASTQEHIEVNELDKKDVVAFCGIGFAEGFKKTLELQGARVVDFMEFLDHVEYSAEHVQAVSKMQSRLPHALCVTTEKDLMRNKELWQHDDHVWVLRINMTVIRGEEYLNESIERLFTC